MIVTFSKIDYIPLHSMTSHCTVADQDTSTSGITAAQGFKEDPRACTWGDFQTFGSLKCYFLPFEKSFISTLHLNNWNERTGLQKELQETYRFGCHLIGSKITNCCRQNQ